VVGEGLQVQQVVQVVVLHLQVAPELAAQRVIILLEIRL
jgi:hypothetical protein